MSLSGGCRNATEQACRLRPEVNAIVDQLAQFYEQREDLLEVHSVREIIVH